MDDLSMWEEVAHGSSAAFILAVVVALIIGKKVLQGAAGADFGVTSPLWDCVFGSRR